MEILAHTTVTRQPEFISAANEAGLSPYMLGVLDAERGDAFCPETYYIRQGDMLAYTEGFEAVRGESEITRSFKGKSGAPVTDAQVDQWQAQGEADEAAHRFATMLTAMVGADEMHAMLELAEYQDDLADADFYRYGL